MKRILALVITASIVLSYGAFVQADPISSTQKENAENQLKQSEANLKTSEDKLAKLECDIEKLDNEIETLMIDLEDNKKALAKSEASIKLAKNDVQAAESELKKQQELFDSRMRAIYKNGSGSYLSIVLKSTSFTDLVTNVDAVNRIIAFDKKIAAELQDKKDVLLEKQQALEKENEKLANLKAEKESKLNKLNSNKASQKKLIDQAKAESNLLAEKVKQDQASVNNAIANMDNEAIKIAMSASSSTEDIKAAISYLENRNKTLKSPNIDNAINTGKNTIATRNKPANRGNTTNTGNSSTPTNSNVDFPSGYSNSSNYTGTSVSGISVALYSQQFLGTPYLWGGTRPYKAGDYGSGFDCSGLVQYCYKQFGISITRTCETQIRYDGRFVNKNELVAGDLIYFGTWDNVHHVGMYIGSGNFIHAPRTGDVIKITPLSSRDDFIAAKRIIN